MPQASDELRSKWGGQMGVGEDKACDYLLRRGYILTKQWDWWVPYGIAFPTLRDLEAMQFLIEEWDYGSWTLNDWRKGLDDQYRYRFKLYLPEAG